VGSGGVSSTGEGSTSTIRIRPSFGLKGVSIGPVVNAERLPFTNRKVQGGYVRSSHVIGELP
jgi:hypothetical protein